MTRKLLLVLTCSALFLLSTGIGIGFYLGQFFALEKSASTHERPKPQPVPPEKEASPAQPPQTYTGTVEPCDLFSQMVQDLYGDGSRAAYTRVAQHVPEWDRDNPDPDHIKIGHTFTFPASFEVGGKILVADIDKARRRANARRHSGCNLMSVVVVGKMPTSIPAVGKEQLHFFPATRYVAPLGDPQPTLAPAFVSVPAPMTELQMVTPRSNRLHARAKQPGRAKKILFGAINISIRTAVATAALGPVGGAIIGGGPPAIKGAVYTYRAIAHRHSHHEKKETTR